MVNNNINNVKTPSLDDMIYLSCLFVCLFVCLILPFKCQMNTRRKKIRLRISHLKSAAVFT